MRQPSPGAGVGGVHACVITPGTLKGGPMSSNRSESGDPPWNLNVATSGPSPIDSGCSKYICAPRHLG